VGARRVVYVTHVETPSRKCEPAPEMKKKP